MALAATIRDVAELAGVSMGTVLQVPWTRLPEWSDARELLHEAGFTIAALALADDAIQTVRRAVEGFVPRRLAQGAVFADQRLRQPGVFSLHAERLARRWRRGASAQLGEWLSGWYN